MASCIRPARADDARAIATVHFAGAREAYPGTSSATDVDVRARHWTAWLRRGQATTLVALADDEVVAFGALHPAPVANAERAAGEVAALFVLPSHWRRGLGRALVEQLLEVARSHGFSDVLLWVLDANIRAQRFYAALGFEPDGAARIFDERPGAASRELRLRRVVRD